MTNGIDTITHFNFQVFFSMNLIMQTEPRSDLSLILISFGNSIPCFHTYIAFLRVLYLCVWVCVFSIKNWWGFLFLDLEFVDLENPDLIFPDLGCLLGEKGEIFLTTHFIFRFLNVGCYVSDYTNKDPVFSFSLIFHLLLHCSACNLECFPGIWLIFLLLGLWFGH